MAPDALNRVICGLLSASGHNAFGVTVAPLVSGGNNRVYAVATGDTRFVAKSYFHDAQDPRDRLQTEFSFVTHAWNFGMRCVPQPIAADPSAHLALFEYVEGRRLDPGDVGVDSVAQAGRFFAQLNSAASRAAGTELGDASEACFSVADYMRAVDVRLERLSLLEPTTSVERDAADFVQQMVSSWKAIRSDILSRYPEPETPGPWRSLSPSDFGFHNALLRPSGDICFIDFEYAGWDDPAKAIGDFFTHPGLPVPERCLPDFVSAACVSFDNASQLVERARLLWTTCRIKWCCIILNEFQPAAARRRRYADAAVDLESRKELQLRKAMAHFTPLTT